jgi:hypothetical protein
MKRMVQCLVNLTMYLRLKYKIMTFKNGSMISNSNFQINQIYLPLQLVLMVLN